MGNGDKYQDRQRQEDLFLFQVSLENAFVKNQQGKTELDEKHQDNARIRPRPAFSMKAQTPYAARMKVTP